MGHAPDGGVCECAQDCVAAGQLSNAQIEAVVYAFMRFEKRLQNGE